MNVAELSLRVYPEDDTLVWEVTNTGADSVRLWQQGNSWGWSMPRLSVGTHVLRPAARVWTRNFPANTELAPQESARYALRAGDFDPGTLEPLQSLSDQPLRVTPELHCEPTPEAAEYGVWCGTLRGEEQELSPPHPWLHSPG